MQKVVNDAEDLKEFKKVEVAKAKKIEAEKYEENLMKVLEQKKKESDDAVEAARVINEKAEEAAI